MNSRSYLAALFTKGAVQDRAFNQINADFQAQLDYLFYGSSRFHFGSQLIFWWVLFRDVDRGEGDA